MGILPHNQRRKNPPGELAEDEASNDDSDEEELDYKEAEAGDETPERLGRSRRINNSKEHFCDI